MNRFCKSFAVVLLFGVVTIMYQYIDKSTVIMEVLPAFNNRRVIDRQTKSTPPMVFTELPTRQNTTTSIPVLVLAYYRSGSTFTGSLLKQAEGSFYRFEPEHQLKIMIKNGLKPKYFNGTTSQVYNESDLDSLLINTVRPFLNCDFTNVPVQLITQGFAHHTDQTITLNECLRRNGTNCMAEYTEGCRDASARIVKVISVRMSLLPELLKDVPNLKVLHLLRDPRGQFVSANRLSGGRPPNSTASRICDQVLNDIKDRLELQKAFPKRFLQVVYEDMAQRPMETAQEIYRFLGLEFAENVKDWIWNSTNGSKDAGVMGTVKVNSTETAYKWTKIIPWRYVKYFDDSCPEIVRWGHFPVFRTEEEVRNFTIPNRPRFVS